MGFAALVCWFLILLPASDDPMQSLRQALDRADLDSALSQLEHLRQTQPDEYHWNQLDYLHGVLLQRGKRKQSARAVLESVALSKSSLADYALLHLIELYVDPASAERQRYTEEFLQRFPAHPKWAETALAYGRELRREQKPEEAKVWLDQVWRRGRGAISRRAALEHALLHLDQNQGSDAIRDLQNLLVKSERDDVAHIAARRLRQLQSIEVLGEAELRRRARVFLNNRDGTTAREYLGYARRKFPHSRVADQYAYLWGRSFVIEGRFSEALKAYQAAYREHSDSSWGEYSLYQAGNLALRMLDYDQAEQFYRQLVTQHPQSRYASRAWFNLADTYLWQGRDEAARRTLQRALQSAPRREQDQFRYALARLDFQDQRFESALAHLERLDHLDSKRLPSGVTREEIHFWKGVVLQALGRPVEAERAFQVAADGSPNYFAFQARLHLLRQKKPDSPQSNGPWMQRLIRPRAWRTAPPPPSSQRTRIQDLLFLSLYDEAALEIRRAGKAAFGGDRIDYLFNLAYYADLGKLPEQSIRAAEQLEIVAFKKRDPSAYPPVIRALLYPRHYWDIVSRYSAESQVEPELILSIIRQESRFQSGAKSIAAARGLMQFMTGTAAQLAGEIGVEPPSESDLYSPELSVRLGAHYLKKLLQQFGGSVEKALAAYNGGAENVRRWAAKLDDDAPVQFVANIGFRETKLYVLKVMGNYFVYKNLVGHLDSQPARAGGVLKDAHR